MDIDALDAAAGLARVEEGAVDQRVDRVREVGVGADIGFHGNRVTAGTFNTITRSSAVKINGTNGNPITAWAPSFPAAARDIKVASDQSKVYVAGYFNNVSGDTNMGYYGWLNTTTGASIPGVKAWQPSTTT